VSATGCALIESARSICAGVFGIDRGWYLTDKTADFFVALLKRKANGHFLWLTGGDKALIEKLMSDRGVNSNQFTVLNVPTAEVPATYPPRMWA